MVGFQAHFVEFYHLFCSYIVFCCLLLYLLCVFYLCIIHFVSCLGYIFSSFCVTLIRIPSMTKRESSKITVTFNFCGSMKGPVTHTFNNLNFLLSVTLMEQRHCEYMINKM